MCQLILLPKWVTKKIQDGCQSKQKKCIVIGTHIRYDCTDEKVKNKFENIEKNQK